MLNLLLLMRLDANSVSGTSGDALVARHGIKAACNKPFGLADTTPLERRRESGNQGSKWYYGRAPKLASLSVCDHWG